MIFPELGRQVDRLVYHALETQSRPAIPVNLDILQIYEAVKHLQLMQLQNCL